MDTRIQQLADILISYSIAVKPGDWVVIGTTTLGEPLAYACSRAVLRAGGNPSSILTSERTQALLLNEASEEQLAFLPPIDRLVVERCDASIRILAPGRPRGESDVDPDRLALQRRAMAPLQSIMTERDLRGEMRSTITQFPTEAAAQDAGMSPGQYADFVYRAAFLDRPDPVEAWRELSRRQQRLIDWLADKRTIRMVGPGTDLTVSVAGRRWANSDGKRNFPSGEIFTGPIEDATTGVIAFNYPAYTRGGEVSGVRLVFERGRVIEASADSGEELLQRMLDLDEGARCLGEFAFGTNEGIQQLTKNTLFDEKIGGTLHMALGSAYPETGGTNVSALHWDMVYDLRQGGEVTVDGQRFSLDGRICV